MRWFATCMMILGCASSDRSEPERPAAGVQIVQPTEGATVSDPSIVVVLSASGIEIAPVAEEREGTAHHHIFLNDDLTPLDQPVPAGVGNIMHMGGGQTEVSLDLEPGTYRIIAVLADWRHIPISPPAIDTVQFTVER